MAAQVNPIAADLLCRRVRQMADRRGRPAVVAIDGKSGTGKSTLARAVAERLDALVVDGDAFFAGGVDLRDDAPQVLAASCIDWERQRALLLALRGGRPAAFHPFDWEAFDGSLEAEAILLEPRPIIILEGVYSARPELGDLIDLSVRLVAPEPLRLARLLARETALGPWERQWHEAEAWYFTHIMRAEAFDLVIDMS